MNIKFIPIDYSSFDVGGKNFVKIVGRDDKGKRVCIIDSYDANFWAILKGGLDEKKIDKVMKKIEKIKVKKGLRESRVLKVELHDKKFLGKDVRALRIFVTNHKDMHDVADQMGFKEIEKRREYDISMISKYITEKEVRPFVWYDVEGELLNNSDRFGGVDSVYDFTCVGVEKISESKKQGEFKQKILAYDIEVEDLELGKSPILMISLYGNGFKKVLTWKHCSKKQDYVECFKDEADMIEGFVKHVKEFDPDVLVGYFSDGFDLPYLRARANFNKMKLDLGLDGSQPVFARGRIPSGKINGIVHIDLLRFIQTAYSQYLQSETLGLNDVASELLGEGKLDFDFSKIGKMRVNQDSQSLSERYPQMNDNDWMEFFSYNLKDSEITYRLAEKAWADLVEFSRIMKAPLFDVSRDSMSKHVENYIFHNLKRFNEIAEKRPVHEEIGKRRALGKYEGAFVFQPTPGLYEDIVMFDFTSMYASVIVSYNLSLSTHIKDKKFSKKKGFFPEMLEEIIEKRKKYKAEYNKDKNPMKRARSNAYKLLANASYGYQGFFGARYYCREAAAATAALAKENILEVIEKIKKEGYKIIYSDTDSIAFLMKGKKKSVLDFLEKLNKELTGIMELDLEDFYKRGLFVSKRGTDSGAHRSVYPKVRNEGAKKKYALIGHDGKLKVRGFETVRRDWCKLARVLQNSVLFNVLKTGNEKEALKIVKEEIENVKGRSVDLNDLIIKTQLKKPIKDYVAKGPHVVAAEKMEAQGIPVSQGMLIKYYIAETPGKSKLVRDKVKLVDEAGEYDIDYYLNKQILPAVENIFEVFGVCVGDVIRGHKQETLF